MTSPHPSPEDAREQLIAEIASATVDRFQANAFEPIKHHADKDLLRRLISAAIRSLVEQAVKADREEREGDWYERAAKIMRQPICAGCEAGSRTGTGSLASEREAAEGMRRANDLLREKVAQLEQTAEMQAGYCEEHKRERDQYRRALISRDCDRPSDDFEILALRRACREYESALASERQAAEKLAGVLAPLLNLRLFVQSYQGHVFDVPGIIAALDAGDAALSAYRAEAGERAREGKA